MEEQLVSLEVARLLEEKGFCNGSAYCYNNFKQELHRNGNGSIYINGLEEDYIEVPTQSLVQKWLRETKETIVLVDYNMVYSGKWNYEYWSGKCGFVASEKYYDTYEEALEEGLKKALKLI